MPIRVEQGEAVRRAQRTQWLLAFVPVLFVLAWAAAQGRLLLDPSGARGLALLLAGLAALAWWSRRQARQIPARYAYAEARLPAKADDLLPGLQAYMRRWWMVSVEDVRRWRSLYRQDVDPAPLRLPFELDEADGQAVLRGSAIHVEAAGRWARRRMAQGRP